MKDSELKALLDAYAIPHKKWGEGKFNDLNRTISRGESKLNTLNGKLGITTPCIGVRILYEMSPSNILLLKPISYAPQTDRLFFPDLQATTCKEQPPNQKDFDVISELVRQDLKIGANQSQYKKVEKKQQQKDSVHYPGMVEIFNVQIYEGYLSSHFYDTLTVTQEVYFKWEAYDPVLK